MAISMNKVMLIGNVGKKPAKPVSAPAAKKYEDCPF